ncbi:MAG: twin-arginine translocase subunit TatB [Alphaproteobacteria bacterium]|nr:MAG: twin-arginine translocase subunit TatB [Alphaproteobacteria bacterium]
MIPDIGWSEMLVIASLAIIVIGPKDLPKVMRTLGQWMGKARAMAREFQKSFDDMAREAELDDLRAQVEALRKADPLQAAKKALDPEDELSALGHDLAKTVEEPAEAPKSQDEAS